MKKHLAGLALFGGIIGLSIPVNAGPLPASRCAADFSTCSLYENGNILNLPGLAIAGDLIMTDGMAGPVSDVFRIFNDVFDSGGGTGLGTTATLFSVDEGTLPATFSDNARSMVESKVVVDVVNNLTETDYNGNGTIYKLFSRSDAPEPSSIALFGLGTLALGGIRVKRRASC